MCFGVNYRNEISDIGSSHYVGYVVVKALSKKCFRFGPNGSAAVVSFGSKLAVKMQSGYLYTYALVMLLGLVTAVSWMMVRT